MTTPRGVWIASATQSGMLCVTRMNSIVNEPTVTRSRGLTRDEPGPPGGVALLELVLDEGQRQRGAVDRAVEERQHVRHGADVILVAVRQHQRGDAVLLQLPQVRNDQVDAEQLRLGEHHARIDEDGRVAAGDDHHVHAELAEPAERDDLERRHAGRYR